MYPKRSEKNRSSLKAIPERVVEVILKEITLKFFQS